MARLQINLGTPPSGQDGDTVRNAFEKVNTMTTELYAAIAGSGFAANVRAVTLAGIVFTSSVAVTATDSIIAAFGKIQAQLDKKAALGANSDITSLSGLTTALSVAQGGTGGKTAPEARAGLQLGTSATLDASTSINDTTVGRVARLGDHGFGVKVTPFIADMNEPVANGYSWVTIGTANPITGFASGSQVLTFFASATEIAQMVFSRSTPMRIAVRRMTTGAWQAPAEIITTGVAVLDPALGTGGIMSSAVVSGWTIEKFLNGALVISGISNTAQLPANQVSTHTFTVPSAIVDQTLANVQVNMIPTSSNDCSVNYSYMTSPTAGSIVVRNGATAQTFSFRIKILARWKA